MKKKTLIKNVNIINENEIFAGSVLIEDAFIKEIYRNNFVVLPENIDNIIDGKGNILIPGVIDDHVHFREPGLTNKGNIKSESLAAIAGGTTSYMDMPNTLPPAITCDLIDEKFQIASQNSMANYSFYIGANDNNFKELLLIDKEKICGIKVFLGSTTGDLLIKNEEVLKDILSIEDIIIAFHSEDNDIISKNLNYYKDIYGENIPASYHCKIRSEDSCYYSTLRLLELAENFNSHVHILHLSTEKELELLKNKKLKNGKITAEVCVQYLWFDEDDYKIFNNKIKCNPSIKSKKDKQELLKGLNEDIIDLIATDHAPHLLNEKEKTYLQAPSGIPLIQYSLLMMLELYHKDLISLETIVKKMCHKPADVFKLDRRGYIMKGYYADLVMIDLNKSYKVEKTNIFSACGWSPFENYIFNSCITHTWINGHLAYCMGNFSPYRNSMPLKFNR